MTDSGPELTHERRVGTTLANKYRLARVLGAGGMGAVFEAENLSTGRRVAVKLMLAQFATDEALAARFLREARVSSRIAHPNIVEVLDLDRDPADGTLYIVQEFLQGRELAAAMETHGRPFTVPEALAIIVPVMRALEYAHSQKVIHRDLKPANIFLVERGDGVVTPKVIDFGIAKFTGEAAENAGAGLSLTRTGAAMGTPYYMSPEQASGDRSIDAQTDIWAIAVVLYEMLSAVRPHDGDSYNMLLASILTQDATRLDVPAPWVSTAVADVIQRALARDRKVRFASMQSFLDALVTAAASTTDPKAIPAPASMEAPGTTPRAGSVSSDEIAFMKTSVPDATPPPRRVDTTLGSSALSLAGTPAVRKAARWPAIAAIAGIVLAASIATALRVRGSTASASRAVTPPAVSVASNSAASNPPREVVTVERVERPSASYRVTVRAQPATATLALDGVDTGASTLVRELPRDGRSHRIVASAPGHIDQTISFVDAAPPDSIVLEAAPATHATGHSRHARSTVNAGVNGAGPSTQPPASQSGAREGSEPVLRHRGVQVQRDYVE